MQLMLENSFTINDMAKGCSRYLKCGHILTFRRESGWTAGCYGKTSGRDLKRSCRESRVTRGARPGTIGASLRRFSGSCGRGVPGVIFRRSWATGTGHLSASPAGDKRASGNGWQPPCAQMPTWRTSLSIRPLCEPTNIRPVPKKRRTSGDRPFAGRTDQQTARGRRRLGQSVARHSLGWPGGRHRACRSADRGSACSERRGRQGIRRGCLRRIHPKSLSCLPGK